MNAIEKLYNNYLERRKFFLEQIAEDPNEAIKKRLFTALIFTEVCFLTFEMLIEQGSDITAFVKRTLEQGKKQKEEFAEWLIKIDDDINNIRLEVLRQPLENLKSFVHLSHTQLQTTSYDYSVVLLMISFQQTLIFATQSLSKLFESYRIEEVKEALEILIKFLIGLTPVGPILEGYQAILSIVNRRKEKLKLANSYLNELDEYIFCANSFCVAIQLFTDNIRMTTQFNAEPELSTDLITIESAQAQVTNRFRSVLDEYRTKQR